MPWSRWNRSRLSKRLGRPPQLCPPMLQQGLGTQTLIQGQITSAWTMKAKTPSSTSQQTSLWSLLQNPLHQQQFIQTKLAPLVVRAPQWISPRLAQKVNAWNTQNHGHVRTTWENRSSTKWPLEKGFSYWRIDQRLSTSPVSTVSSNNKFNILPIDEPEISTIKFKILGPEVHHLEKKSDIAASYYISATEPKIIQPWKQEVVSTQIMLVITCGAYGRIVPYSGLALKGINVGASVIDSNYWGEVKVLLINHSDIQFEIKTGDWIIQLIVKKISLEKLNEEASLNKMKQGDQGFGLMGVAETLKIQILKKPKPNWQKLLSPLVEFFLKRWISSPATRKNQWRLLSHLMWSFPKGWTSSPIKKEICWVV